MSEAQRNSVRSRVKVRLACTAAPSRVPSRRRSRLVGLGVEEIVDVLLCDFPRRPLAPERENVVVEDAADFPRVFRGRIPLDVLD